jgi:hypothetical protein
VCACTSRVLNSKSESYHAATVLVVVSLVCLFSKLPAAQVLELEQQQVVVVVLLLLLKEAPGQEVGVVSFEILDN